MDKNKYIEELDSKIAFLEEVKELHTRLRSYAEAFDMTIEYHKEHITNEDGSINAYHEQCINECLEKATYRLEIIGVVLDALEQYTK